MGTDTVTRFRDDLVEQGVPPRISIIIPAHNMEHFLQATVESVLRQTHPAHEIIVVNDGSSDGTGLVIESFRGRIRDVALSPNRGVSAARNAGAAVATGDWFLFLDGDDRLFPGALEAFSACIGRTAAGVIFGRVEQLDIHTGLRRERTFPGSAGDPPYPAKRNFFRSVIASPGAAIIRRDVHSAIGGYEKPWQPTEDRDYWLKCGVTTRFEFCDAFVLEKLYRLDSVRIFSNKAVFWGMKVQFEFIEWCRNRNIDTAFLETTPAAITEHALRRAMQMHDGKVIRQILEYAKPLEVDLPLRTRCRIHGELLWSGLINRGKG
jgi:glycosyltransferase involved in cell wall biosynthesis